MLLGVGVGMPGIMSVPSEFRVVAVCSMLVEDLLWGFRGGRMEGGCKDEHQVHTRRPSQCPKVEQKPPSNNQTLPSSHPNHSPVHTSLQRKAKPKSPKKCICPPNRTQPRPPCCIRDA